MLPGFVGPLGLWMYYGDIGARQGTCCLMVKKAGWADAVVSTFQRLCKKDRELVIPIRRLVLLKDAIKETGRFFRNLEDSDRSEALGPDDAQGYTMAC